jgi:sec-independent protein translocase protein TatA
MGIGGISPGQLLLIFLIVVVLFGTKKLRTLGQDLGAALHGFKKGLKEGAPVLEAEAEVTPSLHPTHAHTTTTPELITPDLSMTKENQEKTKTKTKKQEQATHV